MDPGAPLPPGVAPLLDGFAIGLGLIVAIGPQGLFVLRQGPPWLAQLIALCGAALLLWYGLARMRAGALPRSALVSGARAQSWRIAAVGCLAATWLNPAVYSDMLVLGGLAGRHTAPDRLAFGVGAGLASVVFFCALGYGAPLLAPLFARPAAWRSLELASGLLIWLLALHLIAACARS